MKRVIMLLKGRGEMLVAAPFKIELIDHAARVNKASLITNGSSYTNIRGN